MLCVCVCVCVREGGSKEYITIIYSPYYLPFLYLLSLPFLPSLPSPLDLLLPHFSHSASFRRPLSTLASTWLAGGWVLEEGGSKGLEGTVPIEFNINATKTLKVHQISFLFFQSHYEGHVTRWKVMNVRIFISSSFFYNYLIFC